ncbi:neugrin isoform X2 [Rattus norvegicus]|uniref:neugrin isoform X2 n=1 Tax=Rattus norvegicus TaxID=10116 RepID=UPI001917726A|nr:neugrin isoform X2 [Rattus norvegicus]
MALSLSLFLGGRVRAAVARCGFASQGVAGPGSISREPDPDSDWEPEERELQEVESALKRQKKAMRFQKIRRQMEAPGAPPRTLTWEAMEQIRFLLLILLDYLYLGLPQAIPGSDCKCRIPCSWSPSVSIFATVLSYFLYHPPVYCCK